MPRRRPARPPPSLPPPRPACKSRSMSCVRNFRNWKRSSRRARRRRRARAATSTPSTTRREAGHRAEAQALGLCPGPGRRDDRAANPRTDFQVRRARLKLEAPITDLASATLEFDASRTVVAQGSLHRPRPQRPTCGECASDSRRCRSCTTSCSPPAPALRRSRPPSRSTLFPSEYDQGVWLQLKNVLGDGIPGTTLDVGLQDGQGAEHGRPEQQQGPRGTHALRAGQHAAGQEHGGQQRLPRLPERQVHRRQTKVTTDKTALGGGLSYLLGPVWLRAEIPGGPEAGARLRGWYGQAAYQFPNALDTALRPLRHAGREHRRARTRTLADWTLGVQHFLDAQHPPDPGARVPPPEAGYSQYAKTNGDLTTLRLQVKY